MKGTSFLTRVTLHVLAFLYLKIDNSCYKAIGDVLPRVQNTCVWVCFLVYQLVVLQCFDVFKAILFWFSKRKDVFFTAEKTL